MILRGLMRYAGVKAFMSGVRPCVTGLILSTAATMLLGRLAGANDLKGLAAGGLAALDLRGAAILGILALGAFLLKRITKKPPSPILLILIAAGLGMIAYSL
jgi:chromate transporter